MADRGEKRLASLSQTSTILDIEQIIEKEDTTTKKLLLYSKT